MANTYEKALGNSFSLMKRLDIGIVSRVHILSQNLQKLMRLTIKCQPSARFIV
jgi:hypothetical protein